MPKASPLRTSPASPDLEDRVKRDERRQLDSVFQDLVREFTALPETTVQAQVELDASRFAGAPVRTFVPVLVRRSARAQLLAIA